MGVRTGNVSTQEEEKQVTSLHLSPETKEKRTDLSVLTGVCGASQLPLPIPFPLLSSEMLNKDSYI